LINLLIFGHASPNVSAYTSSNTKVPYTPTPVGLLSYDSSVQKLPLADHWFNPTTPTYIVHGGDHFTLLYKKRGADDWCMYNGLPPNDALVNVKLLNTDKLNSPAPEKHQQTTWRMEVGQIESIVQSHPDDKKTYPTAWRNRRFELCLVDEDMVKEDAATPERPADVPASVKFDIPELQEGDAWRCVKCYNGRFKTMNFGQNSAGSAVCETCGAGHAGNHTVWIKFGDLPSGTRRRIDGGESKTLTVLRTKWPNVDVEVAGRVLGGEEAAEGARFPSI
jgi:hypothetical protein